VRLSRIIVIAAFLFVSVAAFAQQEYVGRWDVYGGYSFLTTPKLNLFERGFHTQDGYNWKRWLAIGGDFSVFTGHSSILPHMLKPALQQQLAGALGQLAAAGLLPPGYSLYVPYNVTTYTFTVGPQINIRNLKYVTFFIHPSIGGMHQSTSLNPADPIQTLVVSQLVGSSHKTSDTVAFFGVGGGLDLNVSKHMSIRLTSDFVNTGLYSNLLNGRQNDIRFSVGPSFHFGKNTPK
jgi:opacity protein-like surface antigen